MKIIEALRIEKGNAIAIVGAGGKTSLLFALADAVPKPVCLTTTTKLMHEEELRVYSHQMFSDLEENFDLAFKAADVNLVTNALDGNRKKWVGLSLNQADELISVCKREQITCLIEADGARHLPLKAPAEWEPVIPSLVDLVLVVVGLSALGKPLTAETVFRAEIFSEFTGLPVGETIQLEHVIKMLNHPLGGLRGVPPTSRTAVVFNQADAYVFTPGELDLIRETLAGKYTLAIRTSLRTDLENCELIF